MAIRHIDDGKCLWHERLGRVQIFCVSGVRGTANGGRGGNCAIVAICGWDGSTFVRQRAELIRSSLKVVSCGVSSMYSIRKDKITGDMVEEICLVYVTLDINILIHRCQWLLRQSVGVDSARLIGVGGREKVLTFLETLAQGEDTRMRKWSQDDSNHVSLFRRL